MTVSGRPGEKGLDHSNAFDIRFGCEDLLTVDNKFCGSGCCCLPLDTQATRAPPPSFTRWKGQRLAGARVIKNPATPGAGHACRPPRQCYRGGRSWSRAWQRSCQMSSWCSTPQLKRTRLSTMPYSARLAGPCNGSGNHRQQASSALTARAKAVPSKGAQAAPLRANKWPDAHLAPGPKTLAAHPTTWLHPSGLPMHRLLCRVVAKHGAM